MRIGFIDLGKMARRSPPIRCARHDVAIWNRTAVNAGATLAESPEPPVARSRTIDGHRESD